jgi:hypothetical protein
LLGCGFNNNNKLEEDKITWTSDFGGLWGIFSPLCLSNPIQWTLFLSVPKNDLENLGAGALQILFGCYYKTESGQQIGYCYKNGPIIYGSISISMREKSGNSNALIC